jgi:predicted Zn-dependent protease
MSDGIQRFIDLLQTHPGNHLARFSLAKLLFDSGRHGEAQPHFQSALAAKPDWMMAQILLGKCQLQLGDTQAARASFEAGLRLAIDQHHEGPQTELETLLEDLQRG